MSEDGFIKVFIADDHQVVTDGIRAVLEATAPDIKVIGEASDGAELLARAANNPADVYVLDISMPKVDGLEALAKMLKTRPALKAIMLSMHDDRPTIDKALRTGAKGYILKEGAACEIARAIRQVFRGRNYLSPRAKTTLEDSLSNPVRNYKKRSDNDGGVTKSELTIIQLAARGLTTREISSKLGIQPATVMVHRRNIMKKLRLHKQAELVRYAIRSGLVKP
jgi:DNA-binding NarL/FixJ family response regulator